MARLQNIALYERLKHVSLPYKTKCDIADYNAIRVRLFGLGYKTAKVSEESDRRTIVFWVEKK